MKIIVLSGNTSSGKTTTLKMLIAILLCHGAKIIWCRRNPYPTCKSLWDEIKIEMQNHIPPKELTVVLEYKGKRIGIRSFGDVYSDAVCAIKFFKQHKCDIGVLPCHPNSDAQKLIEETYSENIVVFEKEKLPHNASDQSKWDANKAVAEKLFEEIEKIKSLLS